MATSALKDVEVILNSDAGDPLRVQAILADWGLDEATISRMLSENEAEVPPKKRTQTSINRSTPHIPAGNRGDRGSGLHA